MTAAVNLEQGLIITGDVATGMPAARTGYAATAYGAAQPNTVEATWLTVGADGRVTAFAGKVELGQGVRTGFAVEVADELRVSLGEVEVILGDTERVPWDAGTFGSQSTARTGLQLRRAAATARQALLELGADHFDLPVDQLRAADGHVTSKDEPSRSASYADLLVGKRVERKVDRQAPLTPAAEFTVMGRHATRVDAVARVTGKTVYSQDVSVPGMLFAKVLRPPTYGAELVDLNGAAAETWPGVVGVIRDGRLAAVLAETDEAAEMGARLVRATWKEVENTSGRWEIAQLLKETDIESVTTQEAGSIEDGFKSAAHILEGTYLIPYISNAPMEPRAAVAVWAGDKLTVWAGSQRPFGVRDDLARALHIDEADIHVIAPEIGGGFGGKSIYPVAIEAARLAKIAGKPVRVAYTRAEETTWATFRPAAIIHVKSGFKADGTLVAWQSRALHAAEDRAMIGRRGSETPYDVANIEVIVAAAKGPAPAGSFRSLGGAVNHFAREVHMDEIAAAVGADPVEFRLRQLPDARYRRVLEAAAERFGWKTASTPSGKGVGVAIGLDVGSYAATCIELEIQGTEIKVNRVTASVDCGQIVNPDGVVNQVEGSVVMGLGSGLYEAIDVEGGKVLNANWSRYRLPRMHNVPQVETVLIDNPTTPSTGAGEPAFVPVAPACSNAVFDLTKRRFRELPIQRQLT
jgi:nicotinate dehydrogenase subunit B